MNHASEMTRPEITKADLFGNLFVGSVLGMLAAGISRHLPPTIDLLFLTLLLTATAALYPGSAIVNASGLTIRRESAPFILLFLTALYGFWYSPYLVAGGFLLHALWSLFQHLRRGKTELNPDYPMLCTGFDILLAGFIAINHYFSATYPYLGD